MDLDGRFLRRLWLWYGWGGWWFVGRRLLRCFVLLSLREFRGAREGLADAYGTYYEECWLQLRIHTIHTYI